MDVKDAQVQAPLPGKVAALLRESRWFLLVALAVYLALILATFSPADPGWSHSTGSADVHNVGGRLGAWASELLLYVFGLSAYWWVALCLYAVVWGYRRLDGSSISDHRSFLLALGGFALLLVASSSVEGLRLYSLKAALPLAPGGMVGASLGGISGRIFGFTG